MPSVMLVLRSAVHMLLACMSTILLIEENTVKKTTCILFYHTVILVR